MLVASRFYRYFAGNVNTEATERTPLIQPVIAHATTTTKNGDASCSTESNQPGSPNTDAAALPSYSAEEVDTPQYSYFPEPSHASSSTAGALPNYQLFGLETKEILHLPANVEDSSANRAHLRNHPRPNELHPLEKIHRQYEALEPANRALKMSAALSSVPMEVKRGFGGDVRTREVGLEWEFGPSDRFLDKIQSDMIAIQDADPKTYALVAANLLEALPSVRQQIFAGGMAEHPVFHLAAERFENAVEARDRVLLGQLIGVAVPEGDEELARTLPSQIAHADVKTRLGQAIVSFLRAPKITSADRQQLATGLGRAFMEETIRVAAMTLLIDHLPAIFDAGLLKDVEASRAMSRMLRTHLSLPGSSNASVRKHFIDKRWLHLASKIEKEAERTVFLSWHATAAETLKNAIAFDDYPAQALLRKTRFLDAPADMSADEARNRTKTLVAQAL
jgi:hypothetical protein